MTALFSRRLAAPVARLCVRLGISANAVTVAGGACWLVSLALPPLQLAGAAAEGWSPRPWLWLAAAALWCLGYFLDVVDGSVARLTGTGSDAGFFLDYVFHVLFKPAFLFSVGFGLLPALDAVFDAWLPEADGWRAALGFLLLLSIPANGSQASHAAELALRAECAAGRMRPGEGPAALWLGSDAVAAPAAAKRGTPLRTLATLVREVASYYLQAPLFALAVALDAAAQLAGGAPLVPGFGPMPLASALWLVLAVPLVVRIPLRCVREWRRLGLAPPAPDDPPPAPRRRAGPVPFGLPAAASRVGRLRRAYGRFFLRLSAEPVLFLFATMLFVSTAVDWLVPAWVEAVVPATLPFAAVLCAPAEETAHAHVFCRTAAKGGSPDPAGAPWRAPLVVAAAGAVLAVLLLAAIVGTAFWDRSPAVADAADAVFVAAADLGFAAALLSQLLFLPARLRRVYRRLAVAPAQEPATPPPPQEPPAEAAAG